MRLTPFLGRIWRPLRGFLTAARVPRVVGQGTAAPVAPAEPHRLPVFPMTRDEQAARRAGWRPPDAVRPGYFKGRPLGETWTA